MRRISCAGRRDIESEIDGEESDVSDFKVEAYSYEDLVKYRRHEALAGQATIAG